MPERVHGVSRHSKGVIDISMLRPKHSSIAVVALEFPPFPGGIATYAENISLTLSRTLPVMIIAPRYSEKASIDEQLPVYRPFQHQTLGVLSFAQALWKLAYTQRGALIHCADIRAGLVGLIAHLSFGYSYTVMVHGSEALKIRPKRPDYFLLKSIYTKATRVIVNSNATAKIILDRVNGLNDCVVAHLGVDAGWFEEPPASFASSVLREIGPNSTIFCTLGRLERRKGHLKALEAIARFQRETGRSDINYIIAGKVIEPDYEAELRAAASNLPFRVLLTGPLARGDIRRLFRLSKCQLLLATSIQGKIEGFGLVILEAAAQGCPTVATHVGGIPEVVKDDVTGYLVDEHDISAAALAMSRLEEPARHDRIRTDCRSYAQTFTWERCVSKSFDMLVMRDATGEGKYNSQL
jgi:phosphatidyl-myo-inositol dimannoside synthase